MTETTKTNNTKEALIQEGMQQLAENGYHGTGIKKVLDSVQVPKGSFYNYFASKEAYVAEIITHYNQQSLALFDALVDDSDALAIEQLETLYQYMLEKYSEAQYLKGCLVGSLAAEIGHRSELCQKAMQSSVHNWQTRLTPLLIQAQKEESIRSDLDPSIIAELLWSTWEGALIRMQMDGNAESAERVLRILFQQLLVPSK